MLPMVVATAWLVVLPAFAGWKVERVMLGFVVVELVALASSVVMILVSVVAVTVAAVSALLVATAQPVVVAELPAVARLRLVAAVPGTTTAVSATGAVGQRDVPGPLLPFSVPLDEPIETDLQGRFVMGQGKESAA